MLQIVEQYIECWNQTDPQLRRSLIDQVWAADASYTDPLADVRGREAIDAVIAAAQQQFAGLAFSLGGPTTTRPASAGTWGPTGASPW